MMNYHKSSLKLLFSCRLRELLPLRHSVACLSESANGKLMERATTKKWSESSKERIVILGTGWGGFRLAKDLDKNKFEVVVVSPRNHFLFTPLLPSTTVGTLEFGCIQEPIRTVTGITYYQSTAEGIDYEKKLIRCRDVHLQHHIFEDKFDLHYDKLVIAVGTKAATYGIPGVVSKGEERVKTQTGTDRHNVMFLKQLQHARAIRNRILECFERASYPHVPESEKKRLLTFVVVGGGPTSVEFTSELNDFLKNDVAKWYKDLRGDIRVIVIERAKSLLSTFDPTLQKYVLSRFVQSRGIEVMTEVIVKEVRAVTVILQKGEDEIELPFGLCVWSIGNEALGFVKDLKLSSFDNGRIKIDNYLKIIDKSVPNYRDIFAIGDCAANCDEPLGLLAQVANQQARYLANYLNKGSGLPFRYAFLGAMAQLGTFDAVVEGKKAFGKSPKLKGFAAFLAWRSAYWAKSVSVTNKFLIPMFWFKSYFFGRDISRF